MNIRQLLSVRKKEILPILIIAVLGFFVYSGALKGEFVWDDIFLIVENNHIKSISHLGDIFTEDIGRGSGNDYAYYRPVLMLSLLFDHSLWKLNVVGYHITTIMFHILAAGALYWFILTLFKDKFLAFLTGMFFVIHPVHTEDVAYITGRADSMAVFFMITAFILYIKNINLKETKISLFAVLLYILAVLSKEIALVLPGLILLYHYVFRTRPDVKGFSYFIGVIAMVFLLRAMFIETTFSYLPFIADIFQRIPGFLVAVLQYIRLMFWPFNLYMGYENVRFSIFDWRAVSGFALICGLLAAGFSQKDKNKIIRFAILWFFIALIPVSNLLVPTNGYMAEHYLYLPSIGFFLALAFFLRYLYRERSLAHVSVFSIAVLLVFYSGLTVRQTRFWRDPLTVYKRTLKFNPRYYVVRNNLGNVYSMLGRKREAIEEYRGALKINPGYAEAHVNLGNMYKEMDEVEGAVEEYTRAIEIKPKLKSAYYNLATLNYHMGKSKEAIAQYRKAIEIDPGYAKAYHGLGSVYNFIGKPDKAIGLFEEAVKIRPDLSEAYCDMGNIYNDSDQLGKAISVYKKAIKINPGYGLAHFNLATSYYNSKKIDLAVRHFDIAESLGYKGRPKYLRYLKYTIPPGER